MSKVEEVARALAPGFASATLEFCDGARWTDCARPDCFCKADCFEMARAAIAAMREPSEAMMNAAIAAAFDRVPLLDTGFDSIDDVVNSTYRAAIDAALQE